MKKKSRQVSAVVKDLVAQSFEFHNQLLRHLLWQLGHSLKLFTTIYSSNDLSPREREMIGGLLLDEVQRVVDAAACHQEKLTEQLIGVCREVIDNELEKIG